MIAGALALAVAFAAPAGAVGGSGAVAGAARELLNPALPTQREDCSGWVVAVLERAGVDLEGVPTVEQMRGLLEARGWTVGWGRPGVGDLVFFHATRDKNGDGLRTRADRYTHVAVVVEVRADHVVLAHRGLLEGRTTIRMDLLNPSSASTNSLLLDETETAVGKVRRTGELFADLLRFGNAAVDIE